MIYDNSEGYNTEVWIILWEYKMRRTTFVKRVTEGERDSEK